MKVFNAKYLQKDLQRLFVAALFGSALPASMALDYQANVFVDSQYEDNANRAVDGQSDISTRSGLSLNLNQETKRLILDGNYRYGYTDYDKSSNRSRSKIVGNSVARYQLLPGRFSWSAAHNVTELRQTRQAIDIADNQERRQVFSTGPEALLKISNADSLRLTGNYSQVKFDDPADTLNNTSADAEIETGSAIWQRSISTLTNIIGGYTYRKVTRDLDNDVETQIDNSYIGFNRKLRELSYGLQVGLSESDSSSDVKGSSLYFNGDLIKTSGNHVFGLNAVRQRTDTTIGNTLSIPDLDRLDIPAELFDLLVTLGDFQRTGTVDVTNIEASFISSALCSRCSYRISYSFVENDFENDIEDQQHRVTARYTHSFNSTLKGELTGSRSETDFSDEEIDQVETGGRFALIWTPTPRYGFSVYGGYQDREGNGGTDFHNSFGGITFNYTLLDSAL